MELDFKRVDRVGLVTRMGGATMRTVLLSVCCVLSAIHGSSLFASIIIVDQTSIQDAIDAAHDADVILVKGYPTSYVYSAFTIDGKGVAVRSFGGSPFVVSAPTPESVTVTIRKIASTKRASVSGMVLRLEEYAPEGASIEVTDCPGEVVLEAIVLPNAAGYKGHDSRSQLKVSHCANVSVNGLVNESYLAYSPLAVVGIEDSQVRMTDVSIVGQGHYSSGLSGPAVHTLHSLLILANSYLQGGPGVWPSGSGGHGLVAEWSTVIVLGDATHAISGGGGANGRYESPWGYVTPGGNGGNGFDCVVRDGEGSVGLISKVGLAGGGGGIGEPNGEGGQSALGNVTRSDVMPHLSLTTDLVPGGTGLLTLASVAAGNFLVFVADRGGFLHAGGIVGPPLSVVPGGLFVAVSLPHVGPDASLALPFAIPDDPNLRGLLLELQAVLVGDDAVLYSTQAVARVIGQYGVMPPANSITDRE